MSALKAKRAEYAKLAAEVIAAKQKIDASVVDGKVTAASSEVEAATAKARQAVALQEEIDGLEAQEQVEQRSREIPKSRTPGDATQGGQKGKHVRMSIGRAVVQSKGYRDFIKAGKPRQDTTFTNLHGSLSKGYALLSPEEAKDFDAENTPLSIIGDGEDDIVVRPMRDPELVRFEEPRQLALRDLLNVSPTSSDTIQWLRLKAVTRGAAIVPPTTAKPYMNVEFEKKTTAVKTLAVLSKLTEQQIEDAPQLMSIIDQEMRRDLRELEEEEILWGDGTGDHFDGLFHDATVPSFSRAGVGDTLIDTIRRMRTDIRLQRLTPSGVLAHPLDWEAIELEKGDDERYVWAVIQTPLGPRIWGMPVVESESAQDPTTGQRIIVVADWARGATLWDRHDIRAAVGFVDDDFARNLRTMRVENRLAFGIKRPTAFVKHETQAAES